MVVPKKPSNPGLGSRTNSTQAAQRLSKSRSPAAAGSNTSPPLDASSSKKSSGAVTKKSDKRRGSGKSSGSFVDRVVLLLLGLFVAYSVVVCPSDIELENPVCHSLSLYRQHVLEPYVLPPIYQALEHPAVSPYVEKIVDAQERVWPYYVAADVRLRPYGRKAKQIIWDNIIVPTYNKHIVPAFTTHVIPLYHQHVYPRLELFRAKVDPLISPLLDTPLGQAWKYAHRGYAAALPHAQNSYETVQPYVAQAYDWAKPLALNAYENVRVYSFKAYAVSRPYIRLAYSNLLMRLKLGLKTIGKWRKLYVDKQVLKIWEKVVELSGNEIKTVATPSSTSSAIEQTLASVAEPTFIEDTETADLPVTTDEPVTAEEETAPVVPEELIPPTTLSSHIDTPSTTGTEIPEAVQTAPASVSEAYESMTSSMLEAQASIESSISSSVIEVLESESAVPDVPEPSASIATEDVMDVDEETSEDDDSVDELLASLGLDDTIAETAALENDESLEDLLASLGLDDAAVEIAVADSSASSSAEVEEAGQQSLTAEEKAAKKKEKTAKDRAKLEQRHQEWFEQMDALVEAQSVRVREILHALRTSAANALWDRAPIPSPVEIASLDTITSEDYDAMIHIDGERVSLVMDKLSAEGEQLLKGLDAYLKRESKTTKASTTLDERRAKWNNVLGKVEDKFESAALEMQNKVRQWFINVRDIEIRECLAISASVKALAERAQADLGLGYVWLDDVTYYDWQKYHDLMRKYERFDEFVRLVQNGTHTEPPPDPVIDGLDKLQLEQEDLLTGFRQRLRSLHLKALDEVFVEKEVPKTEEAGEPQASILPIGSPDASDILVQVDASTSTPGLERSPEASALDGSSVVIGKDRIAVEQALKDIPVEDPVMSILPIETPSASESLSAEFDASQIILSKDKVQVEEALKDRVVEESRDEL